MNIADQKPFFSNMTLSNVLGDTKTGISSDLLAENLHSDRFWHGESENHTYNVQKCNL